MTSALSAARACAHTILWESLRFSSFEGAIPHILLVVDRTPCTLQKVLLEGYLQELQHYNTINTTTSVSQSPLSLAPSSGSLRIDLDLSATTPCFTSGLDSNWKVTCGVLPFHAETFLDDVRLLQAFLRQCGTPAESVEGELQETRWSENKMLRVFESLAPLLAPDDYDNKKKNNNNNNNNNNNDGNQKDGSGSEVAWKEKLFRALREGPPRELLGCILIERNAFQLELEKYRLRLDLFKMGLRVAEHNHLEIMSRSADALAADNHHENNLCKNGKECCLENEEIINYMRSCSLQPHVSESIGRAIADSIDAWSWEKRKAPKDGGELVKVVPPESFHAALRNKDLWSIYSDGVLSWKEENSCENNKGTVCDSMNNNNNNNESESTVVDEHSAPTADASAPLVITGIGAPLRIICHDGQVLSFDGGMEDCLLNTGYYAAAHLPDRNTVWGHRQRFPVHVNTENEERNKQSLTMKKEENERHYDGEEEGVKNMEAGIGGDALVDADKRGRMKKKEYLSMLKRAGKKPGSTTEGGSRKRTTSPSEDVCGGDGASLGSSIGGTFPVGEVISESFDLSKLNGTCTVFAYPSLFKEVTMAEPQPVTLRIERGIVTDISADAPAEFVELIELVRQCEGACYVRELGIGLSPHVGKGRVLSDVTAFERQFGVHVSLGQRHPLFVKQAVKRNSDSTVATTTSEAGGEELRVEGPVLKRKAGKYHIDVFLDAARLEMGAFAVDFTKGVRDTQPESVAVNV